MDFNKGRQMDGILATLGEYEEKNRLINQILGNIVDYFNIDENSQETKNQSVLDQNLKFASRLQ